MEEPRSGTKEKQLFRSPAEHHLLEGLPEGWELECVPRGFGHKHNDYYWLSPRDPVTGKSKRLRSMNEVRSFLNPETSQYERAKRLDHERDQVRKVVEMLISKIEKRCDKKVAGGVPGNARARVLPQRSAGEIMRVRERSPSAAAAAVLGADGHPASLTRAPPIRRELPAHVPMRARACRSVARARVQEPLSAFFLFGVEQHMMAPPPANAEPRDAVQTYGEAWLALDAEERADYETMASVLEPARIAGLRAKAEKSGKGLSAFDKLDGPAGRGGRGGGRGRGRGGGGKKRAAPGADRNQYALTFSGTAARRATKTAKSDPASPALPQPSFDDAAGTSGA
jgi:hypothetical protein